MDRVHAERLGERHHLWTQDDNRRGAVEEAVREQQDHVEQGNHEERVVGARQNVSREIARRAGVGQQP